MTDQWLYPCGVCGKALRDRHSLQQHMRTQHLHQYKHSCPHCSRGFQRKASLAAHRCLFHGGPVSTQVKVEKEAEPEPEVPPTSAPDQQQIVYLVNSEFLSEGGGQLPPEVIQALEAQGGGQGPMQILVSMDPAAPGTEVMDSGVAMETECLSETVVDEDGQTDPNNSFVVDSSALENFMAESVTDITPQDIVMETVVLETNVEQ